MGTTFWIRRFLLAFVAATALLFVVHIAKGYSTSDSARFAALWGAVFAALFTLIGFIKYKRNPACMLPGPGRR